MVIQMRKPSPGIGMSRTLRCIKQRCNPIPDVRLLERLRSCWPRSQSPISHYITRDLVYRLGWRPSASVSSLETWSSSHSRAGDHFRLPIFLTLSITMNVSRSCEGPDFLTLMNAQTVRRATPDSEALASSEDERPWPSSTTFGTLPRKDTGVPGLPGGIWSATKRGSFKMGEAAKRNIARDVRLGAPYQAQSLMGLRAGSTPSPAPSTEGVSQLPFPIPLQPKPKVMRSLSHSQGQQEIMHTLVGTQPGAADHALPLGLLAEEDADVEETDSDFGVQLTHTTSHPPIGTLQRTATLPMAYDPGSQGYGHNRHESGDFSAVSSTGRRGIEAAFAAGLAVEPPHRRPAQWQSHLGWDDLPPMPNESRRHSLADIPTRRGSLDLDNPIDVLAGLRQGLPSQRDRRWDETSHGGPESYRGLPGAPSSKRSVEGLIRPAPFLAPCVARLGGLETKFPREPPANGVATIRRICVSCCWPSGELGHGVQLRMDSSSTTTSTLAHNVNTTAAGANTSTHSNNTPGEMRYHEDPSGMQFNLPPTYKVPYVELSDDASSSHHFVRDSRPRKMLYVVSFKCSRVDVFYLHENTGLQIRAGDIVIVEADRGQDLGTVQHADVTTEQAKLYKKKYSEEQYKWLMMFSRNNAQGNVNPNAPQNFGESNRNPMLANAPATVAGMTRESTSLKPKAIKRMASPHEVKMLAEKEGNEAKAKRTCQQKVAHLHLEMEILDAEFQWDFQKVIFYYYADKYINFKDLITELYRIYKSRIWLSAVNPASFSQHAMGQPPSGIGPGAITVGDNAFSPLNYSPVDPDPYGAVRPYQIEPTYTPNYPSIPGVVNSFASPDRSQNSNMASTLFPATAPNTAMHQPGNLANYNFYYDRGGNNEHASPQPRQYNNFPYSGLGSDQHMYNNGQRGFAIGQRINAPHQEVQPIYRQNIDSPVSPLGSQQQNWLNAAYGIRSNMPREPAMEPHVLENLRSLTIGNNGNRATHPDETFDSALASPGHSLLRGALTGNDQGASPNHSSASSSRTSICTPYTDATARHPRAMAHVISDAEASEEERVDIGRIHSQRSISSSISRGEQTNLLLYDAWHSKLRLPFVASLETHKAFHIAMTGVVDRSLATGLAQREFARALVAPQGTLQRVARCYLEAEEELAGVTLPALEPVFAKDRAQMIEVLAAGRRVVARELTGGGVIIGDEEREDDAQVAGLFGTGDGRKVGQEVEDGLRVLERMVKKVTRLIPAE
nr:uncharacterized protein pb7e8.02 [Quercus suber]